MYNVPNMLSENDNNNNFINNFKLLTELFVHNGWQNNSNNTSFEHILYTKLGNETEFFEIKLDDNNIYVSVPLKNSDFQYKAKFNNYLLAIKYIESKFNYFNNDNEFNKFNNFMTMIPIQN